MVKRLILSLGCASLTFTPLASQVLEVHPHRAVLTQLQEDFASRNYIGFRHDLPRLATFPLLTEHQPYREALCRLMTEEMPPDAVLTSFLKEYPASLDRPSAELLLALVYVDQGLLPLAHAQLSEVKYEVLSPRELAQYHLAQGYVILADSKRTADLDEAQRHLIAARKDASLVGEQAQLYLGSVAWAQGDVAEARTIFSRKDYSRELAPEAAYQLTLLSFATEETKTALHRADELQRLYPEMASRASLRSAIGQAYYAAGNYDQAIRMLHPLQELNDYHPTTEECYALGTSLYLKGRYDEALAPLSKVSESNSILGAQGLFLLGNARLKLQRTSEAALAFSRAGQHPGATERVREYALYNAILLQDETQRANFGQTVRMAETFVTSFPRSSYRPQILHLMKSIFLTNKDYAESLATLDRLQVKSAELSEAKQYVLLRLGEGALAGRDYTRATDYLNRAATLGAKSNYTAEAYLLQASSALERGEYAVAEAASTKSLATGVAPALAYYIQGYARYNQKQYPAAYRAFEAFTEATPSADALRRADALLRMGDCQLIQKKSAEALTLYRRADEGMPSGNDEALYRIATIYGRWGQYSKQVETLDRIIQQHPESTNLPEVLYDKGRSLVLSKARPEAATAVFDQLLKSYPDTQYARLGAMERAMLAYNVGRTEEAIKAYKELIARYPESDEARSALSDLKNIYIGQERVEEYTAYAATLAPQLTPSESEQAHLQYLALTSRYKKDKQATLPDLESFVRTYPSSREAGRAELLLAGLYLEGGRTADATLLYKKLSAPARSLDLRIPALEALTKIYTEGGKKKEALAAYAQLYAIEGLEIPQHLRYGRCVAQLAYEVKDYKHSIATVEELLKRSDLSTMMHGELLLLQGKSEEATGATGKAMKTYEPLLKNFDTTYGAEGYIRHATLLFRSGKVKEAKNELDAFIAKGTPQQYWLARAFLLLADCYHKQGETYVAQQYLESLRDNYKGTDDDIATMIHERLTSYQHKK